jgi:hypothetical protein
LARDHWELVYGGFIDEELVPNTLHAASQYAEAAMETMADAASALLLGRIQLRLGDFSAARQWLQQAEALGASCALTGPFLAELAYGQRRFERVAAELERVPAQRLFRPRLWPVAAYWQRKRAA